VQVVQDEIVRALAAQTVIISCERSDIEAVTVFPQGFSDTFARKGMFIDQRYRNRHPFSGNIANYRLWRARLLAEFEWFRDTRVT
jgi:hypothetical protein